MTNPFLCLLCGPRPKEKKNVTKTQSPAQGPREFINPDPFESEAAFEAVKAHMANVGRDHPERFKTVVRLGAFEAARHWLEVNYPPPHIIETLGLCPVPIPLDNKRIQDVRPGDAIIPTSDTQVYMVVGQREDGDVGVVAMKMVVVPPFEGNGEGGLSMPKAGQYVDTPEMKTAENAFLMFLRGAYEMEQLKSGCTAIIAMGVDMSIIEFTPTEGMEEFPDGIDAVMRKVLGISEEESAAGRKKIKERNAN